MSASVDEHDLAADPTRYEAEERERFRIQSDQAAAWAMRKYRTIQGRVREVEAIRDAEIARVQDWAAEEMRGLDRDLNYFQGVLIEYAREQRESAGRKSVSTPYGQVKSRVGQPKWAVDADEFLPWARHHQPDLIRVKEEPNLTAIKEFAVPPADAPVATSDGVAITNDGEVIPGVRVTAPSVSYTVEVTL